MTKIGTSETGDKTYYAKWDDTKVDEPVTDDKGNAVTVVVNKQWLADYDLNQSDLSKTGENGILVWKSYVLGLEPTNAMSKTVLVSEQSSDASHVTLKLGNGFAPRTDAGVTVKYQLGAKDAAGDFVYGKEQDTSSFNADLPSSGVKYYCIRANLYGSPQ